VKNSFTLFELLVVLLIISFIYSLTFSFFSQKQESKTLNIENIHSYLKKYKTPKNSVEMICVNECFLYIDKIQKNSLNFQKDFEVEYDYGNIKIDDELEEISFKFTLLKNGYVKTFEFYKNGEKYRYNPLGEILLLK
jgi:type II secretory pathway pseudopilin PulG